MIHTIDILNYGYASLSVLSFIVFFDVCTKTKGPFFTKFFLLTICFATFIHGIGHIYCYYKGYNRLIMELPHLALSLGFINFLYQLYGSKFKNTVLIFSIFLIILQIFLPFIIFDNFSYSTNNDILLNPQKRGLVFPIRLFFTIILLFLTFYVFISMLKKYKNENFYYLKLRKWMFGIIWLMSLGFLLNLTKTLIFPDSIIFYFFEMIVHLLGILYVLYRPILLNKIPYNLNSINIFNRKSTEDFSQNQFSQVFFIELFYLREKASLQELADLLNTKTEVVSNFLLENYETSFTDLVNKYRIFYFIELINKGENKNLTIEALALKSGFSSRQNMQRFFKKFHGGSPSDLINIFPKGI